MAKKERISVAPAGGGLFRPNDETGSGIQIKPEAVIGFTVVVIVFEILLHFYGPALF